MPKITFSSENKAPSFNDWPKLFLENGEKARIVVIDEAPHVEFINTLKAPTIVSGQPVMEELKNKDGSTYTRMKEDFIGRHISLGRSEILADKKWDENDPVSVAANLGEEGFRYPERRFAVHVIRYKTKPGTFEVQTPFQPELLVWAFGERVFNQLIEFAEEWGDLRTRDLLLGPCENKTFQKFDINVAAKAAWQTSDETKKLTKEVYDNNKLEDITIAIARRLTPAQVNEDIEKVRQRYAIVNGAGAVTASAPAAADDLFNSPAEEAPDFAKKEEEAAPAPASEPATKDTASEDFDLDSLLNL